MNKDIQLYIFPYAGGSIASFKRMTNLLADHIDVIAVEYPGRGTRAKEQLATSFERLLDDAISFCQTRRNSSIPYSVMGYSMGSILAYEMVARNALDTTPKHMFIAAEVAPKERALELRKVENPTDERIIERAKKLGGFNDKLLGNKRFYDIYMKPMMSDYRLFFEYRFSNRAEIIKSDSTVFYCEQDTPYADVQKWENLIDGKFDYHEFGDNHFFINQHYEEMSIIINDKLHREVMYDI
jgi:surfactin synthase thioesterase subunit